MHGLVQADRSFQGLDEGIVQPLADALTLKDGLALFHARLAILASVAALLGLIVAIWNARLIARPVVALTEIMGRLASHDM